MWRVAWAVLLAMLLAIPTLFVAGYALNSDVPAWIIGVTTSAVVLVFWFGLYRMTAKRARDQDQTSLVDVARYLDTSRVICGTARHSRRFGRPVRAISRGRYWRIIVVGHGVGDVHLPMTR